MAQGDSKYDLYPDSKKLLYKYYTINQTEPKKLKTPFMVLLPFDPLQILF